LGFLGQQLVIDSKQKQDFKKLIMSDQIGDVDAALKLAVATHL